MTSRNLRARCTEKSDPCRYAPCTREIGCKVNGCHQNNMHVRLCIHHIEPIAWTQLKYREWSISAISIYHSNIRGHMGANNKDLQDNYILIDDFMLILELIVFYCKCSRKVSLWCFVWPHLDFCDRYNHCLYLFQYFTITNECGGMALSHMSWDSLGLSKIKFMGSFLFRQYHMQTLVQDCGFEAQTIADLRPISVTFCRQEMAWASWVLFGWSKTFESSRLVHLAA